MTNVPRISAVFLDADGVVQLPARDWRIRLEALCGCSDQLDNFVSEIFEAEDACLAGTLDFETQLARVLEKWGIASSFGEVLRIWASIEPNYAILELVSELRHQGVRVALATNQQRHRAAWMSKEYAPLFDHLLFSCDLGCAKPSPEYYQAALSSVGIEPDSVLFLDDREANIETAKASGMCAELFHIDQGVSVARAILRTYGVQIA